MVISDRQFEIIEAAGKILSTLGVSGLTIKNLAKQMKFSESAIYRHFASKEEIIIALLEYLADSTDQRYLNAISEQLSSEEKFTILFQNQFLFFKENPHFAVVIFSDGLLEESERINALILKIMTMKMRNVLAILEEGQQKGIFTNALTAEELTPIVMGAMRLQMFRWRIANFQFDIEQTGLKMIQSLLTLLKAR